MSACNNDVTYHEKWDTKENNAALKKLTERYFDYSVCSPSCPVSWAPEVLALFEELDKKLGIRRNEETIQGYRVVRTMFQLAIVAPFSDVKHALKTKTSWNNKETYSIFQRVGAAKTKLIYSLTYARKAFMVKFMNARLNKLSNARFSLSQVKEKYGYLTIYYNVSDEDEQYVKNLIDETEMKLAIKGAYYPIHLKKEKRDEQIK